MFGYTFFSLGFTRAIKAVFLLFVLVAFVLVTLTKPVVAAQPVRLITLSPHGADLVHAIGAQNLLVGVSEYTHKDFSKNVYGELPQIGNAFSVDWKLLAKLKPTLAVVWASGTPLSTQKRLKALGIPIFLSEPSTLRDIVGEADALAKQLGVHLHNKRLHELKQQLLKLEIEQSTYNKKTVFHPIWPQPLMTINAQHVITDAMKHCGLVNVFENTQGLTPTVNLADVLRANPHYLLFAISKSDQEAASWGPLINAFPAQSIPKTIFITDENFHQQGPGLIQATQVLCAQIRTQ